ncbi:type VII secretion-associated protein [Nocardia salmonicida]|uniref:type VII secretion-associated protein n=1 Tax=Nocardia salmonicida TaxID=53431 RepID=UPI0036734889
MSDIDVVITSARMWARTATRHSDLVPSVMPVQSGIAVGVSIGANQPSASVVTMGESAWIGYEPAPVSAVAATDAVFDKLFADLGSVSPGSTITVAHAGYWSSSQRASVERSLGRYSNRVVIEPIAARIALLRQSLGASELIAVVEIEPLHLTVSAVARSRNHVELAACEHEPTLGADELGEKAIDRLIAMIRRVVDDHRPSTVIVVGQHDERLLERLRAFVTESWNTQPPPVQSVAFTALLRPRSAPSGQPVPTGSQGQSDWVGTLRDRAASSAPSPWVGTSKVIAAAAVILIALAVGVVVIATNSGSGTDAAATAESVDRSPMGSKTPIPPFLSATSLPPSTGAAKPSPHHVMGRVAFDIPADWKLGAGPTTERATLTPTSATPARITVTYNTVAEGAGYDEVLKDITSRIDRAAPGRFGSPERDVVFAGRRGIGYQERPGDGSVVRWYILLDHGVQTNVGCQHGSEGWGTVSAACEDVMRSVAISP